MKDDNVIDIWQTYLDKQIQDKPEYELTIEEYEMIFNFFMDNDYEFTIEATLALMTNPKFKDMFIRYFQRNADYDELLIRSLLGGQIATAFADATGYKYRDLRIAYSKGPKP